MHAYFDIVSMDGCEYEGGYTVNRRYCNSQEEHSVLVNENRCFSGSLCIVRNRCNLAFTN